MNQDFQLEDAAHLTCSGGWPIAVLAPKDIAIEITKNYWNGLFVFDDSENERFRNKKPEVLRMIVRSYAHPAFRGYVHRLPGIEHHAGRLDA